MTIIPAGKAGSVHTGPAPELSDEAVQALAAQIARWIRSGHAKGLMIQRTRADYTNKGLDAGRGLYYVEIQNDGLAWSYAEGDDAAQTLEGLIDAYDFDEDNTAFYLTPGAPCDMPNPKKQ